MRTAWFSLVAITAALGFVAAAVPCVAGSERESTAYRIENASQDADNWLSHGKGYDETRFSPPNQINPSSIDQLGLTRFFDLDVNRGQESTPLVVDGNVYTTSSWSKVEAFDGPSGRLLWRYDPQVPGEVASRPVATL